MVGYYKGKKIYGDELPTGGAVGDVLIKKSNKSGDVDWSSALNNKVDKEEGKGLSSNDYDDIAKGIVDNVTSDLAGKVDKVEGKGLSTNDYDDTAKGIVDGVTSALAGKVDTSAVGTTVAELDNGKVPSSQLPSYVDDVEEYSSTSAFPVTGESGKIYVALDTNKTYRWSGSEYVEISESLALGETSSTAYAGNKGKANADNISAIQEVIPSNASTSNKLATMSDVGGGGHVIKNQAGTSMTQRSGLEFLDAQISDDSTNDVTKIEVFKEVTKSQLDNLGSNTDGFYSTTDESEDEITASNLIYTGNKTVKTALDERALQSDLTNINATGSTNTTGSTITSGTYFYLDGVLVRAKTDIASGATFTLNTNYEAVTAGALNWINSDLTAKTVVRQNYVNGQTVVNVTAKETSLNGHGYLVFFPFFTSASNIALDARYVYITEGGSGLISSWFVHNTTNELSSITYSGNVITFTFNNAVYVTPCYLKII